MSEPVARTALTVRKHQLEAEINQLNEQSAKLQTMAREKAAIERELAEIENLLRGVRGKPALPLLENVRIAAPCNKDWDQMQGDDHVRYCGACEKNVYNLSSLTSVQAEALIREKEGDTCVRFYQRSDGTVLTADCPVGVRKRTLRTALAAVAASVVSAAATAFGIQSWSDQNAEIQRAEAAERERIVAEERLQQAKRELEQATRAFPDSLPPSHERRNFDLMPRHVMGKIAPPRGGSARPTLPKGKGAASVRPQTCEPGDPLCTDL